MFCVGIFASLAALMFNCVRREDIDYYSPYEEGEWRLLSTLLLLYFLVNITNAKDRQVFSVVMIVCSLLYVEEVLVCALLYVVRMCVYVIVCLDTCFSNELMVLS